MATTPEFDLYHTAAATALAAGVATDIDIPAAGATRVTITLQNSGATNAITALTLTTIPLATPGAARSITTGIPLAAGAALTIGLVDEPCSTIRLTVNSASGTTATVEAVGR